jgi:hypothetical protein
MSVEVHIERLVVDGFDGLDGRALASALERELARRLGAGALDRGHLARAGAAVPAHRIELPVAAGAAALGAAAAGAVADLLGAPAGSRAAASPGPADAGRGRERS